MLTDRRHINIKSRTVSRPTPIPPRASAYPQAVVKAQPRYHHAYQVPTDEDITGHPTAPSPVVWQYETSQYVAESSLASLSLFTPRQTPRTPAIDVLDTQPVTSIQRGIHHNLALGSRWGTKGNLKGPTPPPRPPLAPTHPPQHWLQKDDGDSIPRRKRSGLADTASRDLADIDTAPPPMAQSCTKRGMEIADIPTVPPAARRQQRPSQHTSSAAQPSLPTVPPAARRQQRSSQHTSSAAQSSLPTDYELFHSAQTLATDDGLPLLRFNPFDRFRWWLLYPGRLETLLWSGGAVLLVGLTVFLSVVTVLSLVASHPDRADFAHNYTLHSANEPMSCGTVVATNDNMQKCVIATAASPDGLQISLFSTSPFMAGTTVHLQGHGFRPSGRVIVTHDANQPCQPGTVQVDQHGDFSLVLSLRHDLGWSPGNRSLMVEDVASGHSVMLAFVLCTNR